MNNRDQTQTNSNANGQGEQQRSMTGMWGGQHIFLEVTDGGAELNYDCAHGTINGQIVLDGAGKFTAKGRHVRERPGPTWEGQDEGVPAEYSGSVEGDKLALTVTLADSGEAVGTFTLTRGARGRIRKCL